MNSRTLAWSLGHCPRNPDAALRGVGGSNVWLLEQRVSGSGVPALTGICEKSKGPTVCYSWTPEAALGGLDSMHPNSQDIPFSLGSTKVWIWIQLPVQSLISEFSILCPSDIVHSGCHHCGFPDIASFNQLCSPIFRFFYPFPMAYTAFVL